MEPGRITIESYGCTMNHGEAREAASILSSMGYDVHLGSGIEGADTILLFTCDVITTTENRMWKRISEITSSGKKIIVAGCLASIAGDEIRERYPSAVVLGSMGLEELRTGLEAFAIKTTGAPPAAGFTPSGERIDTIVPISSGCVGNCSYCITRVARGRVTSYDVDVIVEMIRSGLKKGRREILLTSQDSAAYGMEDGSRDLGSLLGAITNRFKEDIRIRVGMMNPVLAARIMESILDGFQHPTIFKFFHIPVQSGSDKVLGNMERGYTVDGFRKMLSSIRSRFGKATISTDIIVGFPGETDEDHRSNLDILEEISPEVLNITRFSARPGTPASTMEGQIKGWIMKERSREITKVHSGIIAERMKERLGHHQSCLVTEIGKEGTMMARDGNYTPIVIEADKEILGRFVDIDSSRIGPSYLFGGKDWKVC